MLGANLNSTKGIDLGNLLDEAFTASYVPYRDALLGSGGLPGGDAARVTRAQAHAWAFLKARKGKGPKIAMIGAKGSGKALANSERVLTPTGWVPNGDLAVDDFVIGADGRPTRVTGVFPQGVRSIYRVRFNDGVEVRADADHLWNVQTGSARSRGGAYKTLTTAEIAADLLTSQGYAKWYVPTVAPVEFEPENLPLPPYALGALLGDGGLTGSIPMISSGDQEIVDRVAREVGAEAVHYSAYDYALRNGGALKETLTRLGVYGKRSHEKYIPDAYLRGRAADRLELLRGLMDTDGTVTSSGTGSFSTVSVRLAEGVAELVRSLGGSTRVRRRPTNGGLGYAFHVRVSLPVNPFWVPRKADRYNVDATQGRARSIVMIVPDGEEEATCISVAAEDSLYVTEGYTVTHNTWFGAAYAFHMGQTYPESMGCIISNTYTQAKDNAGAHITTMARMLGYRARFFASKTIRGRPYSSLFVIDLDGRGFEEGKNFYILVRSFEAVNKLEGIELDWLWCEEIQDAREEDYVTVSTRVRGTGADNSVFVAGMPEDEIHWQYKRLVAQGMIEEADVRSEIGVAPFNPKDYEEGEKIVPEQGIDYDRADVRGILFEPSIFENQHNLPPTYIPDLRSSLDEQLAERWIYGRRTSMSGNRVAYNYTTHVHSTGRMSHVLCHYDPALEVIVSVDFNVSPLCATVWQVKRWNDAWDAPDIIYDREGDVVYRKVPVLDANGEVTSFKTEHVKGGFLEIAVPNREILAQIGEYEIWEGGTRRFMEAFVMDFGPQGVNHQNGIRVLGDATGDRRDTRSETTDWQIIQNALSPLPNVQVTPGVEIQSNYKTGRVTYKNPERRDTFNVLNAALKDAYGKVHVCFLPSSEFESGGAAASVHAISYRGDGTVNDDGDKKSGEKKGVARTHFFDTVRYVVWDHRGGAISAPDWATDEHGIPEQVTLSKAEFTRGTPFGDDWGSIF